MPDFLVVLPHDIVLDNVLPFPSALANVGAAPDIPNIHNVLTNIGHRFGHQSGPDESSGQNPAAI